jgi:acetylornithine deacetylase/succinyl-diaminopimelate desuccinylase-like protein
MNPANLAGYVIFKLKDIFANRVRVPNIYKQMRRLSQEEIASITMGSETWEEVKQHSSSTVVTPYRRRGEQFAPAILTGTRPSLDVHGISSGFTEKGRMKTVIPSTALVKFSIRLVPFMDPKKTAQLVERYVKKLLPTGTEYTLTVLNSSKAYLTDPRDEQIENLKAAYVGGFGKEPALTPSGGSVGLVTTLADRFGTKSLLASYGLPDDRLHGPNEKYNISQFQGGFLTFCEFLKKKDKN